MLKLNKQLGKMMVSLMRQICIMSFCYFSMAAKIFLSKFCSKVSPHCLGALNQIHIKAEVWPLTGQSVSEDCTSWLDSKITGNTAIHSVTAPKHFTLTKSLFLWNHILEILATRSKLIEGQITWVIYAMASHAKLVHPKSWWTNQ